MKVAMPRGSSHGWGIAGEYLSREIARLPPVAGVTLHCIGGVDLQPIYPDAWDEINIGYTFFEDDIEVLRHSRRAALQWDHIVAGSSWCEQHLRIGGVRATSTILQGIDPANFSPAPPRPADGRFIVFSGGKFEARKSQDIVIAAMKIFMARHADVWLSSAWHNIWPFSMATMLGSRLITYSQADGEECQDILQRTLQENGIPLDRVLLHPLMDNRQVHTVYINSDIGLFPNRCEGGNNMVMSEYMACGRTVIASDASGQGDVITRANAFPLTRYEPQVVQRGGVAMGIWYEPSLDEVVEMLEHAYADRDEVGRRGFQAGEELKSLRWENAARKFHDLARQLAEQRHRAVPVTVSAASGQDDADSLLAGGLNLLEQGEPARAEAEFRRALALKPFSAEVYNCLGSAVDEQGRMQEALACFNKALSLQPDTAVIHYNIGNALKKLEQFDEAADAYRQALALDPELAEAHYNLGLVLQELKLFAEAAASYRRALSHRPGHASSWHNLGDVLQEQGEFEEAVCCYQRALATDPHATITHNSLGNALLSQGNYNEAVRSYEQSLKLNPGDPMAMNNLGVAFKERGELEQAISCHRQVLAVDPENGDAHWNLSLACLMNGDFATGWQEYDWRWSKSDPVPRRELPLPCWDGTPLAGRRIILTTEQGAGDTLQFIRYAPLVAARGGVVLVECQFASLKPLMSGVRGVAGVFAPGEPLPEAACHFPLMSLPKLFSPTLETIPAEVPYIVPDPARVKLWQEKVAADGSFKVGIVWAGRQNRVRNRKRTCNLEAFAALAGVPGVTLYSLQVGEGAEQALLWISSGRLVDLTAGIRDYADTAALMESMDLIVTIDTSVAHLAGALGRPVWTLLHFAPDWRWMLGRADSPWYPTMRLFRQQSPGDWQGVMAEVREALLEMLS